MHVYTCVKLFIHACTISYTYTHAYLYSCIQTDREACSASHYMRRAPDKQLARVDLKGA